MSNIMDVNFNGTTAEMLKIISDYDEVTGFNGAYNIREDSKCAGRRSSENITIESKEVLRCISLLRLISVYRFLFKLKILFTYLYLFCQKLFFF